MENKNLNLLYAVFNPDQLNRFCKKFNLDPSDLTCYLHGWHKFIILSPKSAYSFPRDPTYQANVLFEHELNKLFHSIHELQQIPISSTSQLYMDGFINFYTFREATLIQGRRFDEVISDFSYSQICDVLIDLVSHIAKWHAYSSSHLDLFQKFLQSHPKNTNKPTVFVKNIDFQLNSQMDVNHWANSFLSESFFENAMTNLQKNIRKMSIFYDSPELSEIYDYLVEKQNQIRFYIHKLHALPPVLIHGDIHEDQFFISNFQSGYKISGIIDWESARIANPVWEFNFFEWGLKIWEFDNDLNQLNELLKLMWNQYCNLRGLDSSTEIGIQIFYFLIQILYLLLEFDETMDLPSIEAIVQRRFLSKTYKLYKYYKNLSSVLTLGKINKE